MGYGARHSNPKLDGIGLHASPIYISSPKLACDADMLEFLKQFRPHQGAIGEFLRMLQGQGHRMQLAEPRSQSSRILLFAS